MQIWNHAFAVWTHACMRNCAQNCSLAECGIAYSRDVDRAKDSYAVVMALGEENAALAMYWCAPSQCWNAFCSHFNFNGNSSCWWKHKQNNIKTSAAYIARSFFVFLLITCIWLNCVQCTVTTTTTMAMTIAIATAAVAAKIGTVSACIMPQLCMSDLNMCEC